MNILFFDLECANRFNGIDKICEFGAVLVDSNFNFINQYSFCMSPGKGNENRFDKKFWNEMAKLPYTHKPAYYFKCPLFNHFYRKIRHLLGNKKKLVFGYAVNCDCSYLNDSIMRYHLPTFQYDTYDLLPIIKQYSNVICHGLEDSYHAICKDSNQANLKVHLAVGDALMTMQIAKHLCKALNVNIWQLIAKYPICKLDVEKYLIEKQEQRRKKKELQHQHHLLHQKWHQFCNQYKSTSFSNSHPKISLSDSIIHHAGDLDKTINRIKELKLVPCLHYEDALYYLVATDDQRAKLINDNKIKSNVILTLNELIEPTIGNLNQNN